jgi:hypothetical protein
LRNLNVEQTKELFGENLISSSGGDLAERMVR